MNERPRITDGRRRSPRCLPPVRRLLAVAAAAAAVSAAGCSSQSTATQTAHPADPNIMVAAVPATGAAGLYIAEQRGLFSAAGLHVTIEASGRAADVSRMGEGGGRE